jgi:hypothetical protein
MFGPLVGADVGGVLLAAGAEVAGADVADALAGAGVAGALIDGVAGALVGCGEPAAAKTCGALVGGTLPEPPLIDRVFCNQVICLSVRSIARAA